MADARAMKMECAILAREVASRVTPRRSGALEPWLERLLIEGADPFTAAVVIGSSPYSHALSHELEGSLVSAWGARSSRAVASSRRDFPFASVAFGSCQHRDPETLVAAYRDGSVADKQRLLVPLAHHRAFPGDVDLATAIRETTSASRVIYAAGTSWHLGLAALEGPEIPSDLKRAARWWTDGPDPLATDR